MGVRPGDRVGLLALNSVCSVETLFAALWAGAIAVPVNHRLSETETIAQLADADVAALVVGPEFVGIVPALRAALPDLRAVIGLGEASHGTIPYEEALGRATAAPDAERSRDDVACLFYTGGTTGTPKGVMLSHGNIMANSMNFLTQVRADNRLVHLHCGPLYHVAAASRLFSVTQICGTHVMLPRFAPEPVLDAIERHRVTLATFVPTMMRLLLDSAELGRRDLSSLRCVTYGAAPTPTTLLRELASRLPGVALVQSYGMTETSPIATMLAASDHVFEGPRSARLRSAGRPALLAEIRTLGPDGAAAGIGCVGEVAVRGPMVMQGYWRNPEATASVLRDGWRRTGDLGFMDADGYLFVVDRLKDVIISGGENVFSQEVEDAVASHPGVAECAVIGMPDPVWGEAVHAVVVPRRGQDVSAADVIRHCRTRIAPFKCPRSVEIRTAPLPLSAANKVLKSALRPPSSLACSGEGF